MPNLDFAILVREFVTLFVVIDPVGSLPVFYFATRGVPEALHWRFALRGVLVAGAVFPLAMPSIASPGAMLAVVILTDNHRNTISEQVVTAALLVLVLVITFAILLLARPLKGIIGNTGANVVSRVMGIVLATVAVDSVLNGFEALGVMALPDSGV